MFILTDVNETPRLQRHSQPLSEREQTDSGRERHRETGVTAVLLNLDRKVMKLDL